MRRVPLAGLMVVLFASHAAANPVPYRAVVIDTEVTLRAGASDSFPDTGTLRKGAVVEVEKDEGNGWLAVTAPKGSVSWIASAFVEDLALDQPAPRNGLVNHDGDVTLAVGKAGLAQPLNIRREKVPQGTTVLIIGPTATFDSKKWLPIEPPPGDVRYLPKTAVQFDKPATNNFTVRVNESVTPVPPGAGPAATPAGGPLATVPGPAITPTAGGATASKPVVNHPLWAQAETAERENRLADAEKAYFDLAAVMNAKDGDHDVASLCYSRIHMIRTKQREARGQNTSSGAPSVLRPPTKEDRVARPVAKEDRGVRPGTPEPLPPAAAPDAPKDERPEWYTGKLVFATTTLPGVAQTYMLESPDGVVKFYVSAGPGVELAKFVGKRVEVYGAPAKKFNLRTPYMVATEVAAVK